MKIELLQYVKSFSPASPIPSWLMTMGDLAELLTTKAELEEGMKLMMTLGSDDDKKVDGIIMQAEKKMTRHVNPATNGSVRPLPRTTTERTANAADIALDENGNLRPYASYSQKSRGALVDNHEIHSYTWDGE
jgi:activator of 2-hydroxyglutaryl-CoA dehydratase